MASINYSWQGTAGLIVFPAGTKLDDEAAFTVNGSLSVAELVEELDEARHWNTGNLNLPLTFNGNVSPRQLLTGLGVLGWFIDPDAEFTAALDAENAADEAQPGELDDDSPIF